jgi:hypothetical protein
VLTAQRQPAYDPKLTPLRTRDDVRRYVGTLPARNAARQAGIVRRQQLFRRATLLSALCFSVLQYYFLSIGVEMLSIPNLIVFIPTVGAG